MATVDRVLPWRRHAPPPADEIAPARRRLPPAPSRRRPRHDRAGPTRWPPRPTSTSTARAARRYINHPLSVAQIVADIGLDDTTVAAALLHDAVEDTELTLGRDRASASAPRSPPIVDGVTKLDRIHFDSKEEQQAATMRKMLVAMAKDLRVLIIKLADRLHNMRTLAAMPPEQAGSASPRRRSTSTPRWPTASGMQEIKQQLEDLSFAALHPKRYAEIDHLVAPRTPEQDLYLAEVVAEVQGRLAELKIDAEVTGRAKHLWSIYEKMVLQGQGVRRHLRPGGHPGHRRLGEGLLRRARLHPRHVEAGGGAVQGLHRHAQVQPLPVAAHHGDRARRASRSRCRSAPGRCTSGPSGASPPTGRTRRARPPTTWPG